jgi:exo-1,4-beta-D-glucosaminidase
MLNKGWPSLLWDLYNFDDDEAGSFFGAQEANEAVHALYTYDNQTVTVDNLTGTPEAGLVVEAKVYDLSGNVLDDQTSAPLTLASQEVDTDVLRPRVPAPTAPADASVYFVELLLRRGGTVIDRNVYWLSTSPDVVNWKATEGSPQGTLVRYADLKALQNLPPAIVAVSAVTRPADQENDVTSVTITNTSRTATVGFFLRADLRRGTAAGTVEPGDNEVLPIIWSSNDVTLWPGESETLTASYGASLLQGAVPVVSVSGWNVPPELVTGCVFSRPWPCGDR